MRYKNVTIESIGYELAPNVVTAEDLESARRLSESGNADWPRVHSIYDKMLRRQDALKPLLPLTDKRGYQAEFRTSGTGQTHILRGEITLVR